MPPAVIAGGIAAVGSIGGAILGSNAQKDAAEQANDSQQAAVQAQLQLGQQSLALQERLANQSLGLTTDIYNSNYGLLSPYVSRGNVAGDAINALLGLPSAPVMTSPLASSGGGSAPSTGGSTAPPAGGPITTQPVSQTPVTGSSGVTINPSAGHILAPGAVVAPPPGGGGQIIAAANAGQSPGIASPNTSEQGLGTSLGLDAMSPAARAYRMGQEPAGIVTQGPASPVTGNGDVAGAGANTIGGGSSAPPAAPPSAPPASAPPAAPPATGGAPAAPAAPALSHEEAFQQFANSAGMQFALDEMSKAVNHGYAGIGSLQSGAAMKELQDRAFDVAVQGYFMPYMGLLGGQQATGAQAAAATAGVGSSFGNTAAGINQNLANASTGINAGMGSAIQSGANSASNAALASGLANANMWSGIGGALGSFGSSFVPGGGY